MEVGRAGRAGWLSMQTQCRPYMWHCILTACRPRWHSPQRHAPAPPASPRRLPRRCVPGPRSSSRGPAAGCRGTIGLWAKAIGRSLPQARAQGSALECTGRQLWAGLRVGGRGQRSSAAGPTCPAATHDCRKAAQSAGPSARQCSTCDVFQQHICRQRHAVDVDWNYRGRHGRSTGTGRHQTQRQVIHH